MTELDSSCWPILGHASSFLLLSRTRRIYLDCGVRIRTRDERDRTSYLIMRRGEVSRLVLIQVEEGRSRYTPYDISICSPLTLVPSDAGNTEIIDRGITINLFFLTPMQISHQQTSGAWTYHPNS